MFISKRDLLHEKLRSDPKLSVAKIQHKTEKPNRKMLIATKIKNIDGLKMVSDQLLKYSEEKRTKEKRDAL